MPTAMIDPAERRKFLEERRGIGASDVGPILGKDEFEGRTALDIYQEKTTPVDALIERPLTIPMLRGIYQEPVARAYFHYRTGIEIATVPVQVHPSYPWLRVHPDGVEPDGTVDEIKAPGLQAMSKARTQGLPEQYSLQLQTELLVMEQKHGRFVLFSAEGMTLLAFEVKLIEWVRDLILAETEKLWNAIVNREPPPATVVEFEQIPTPKGDIIQRDDPAWERAVADLCEARELKRAAEMLDAGAKANVKELMGTHGYAEGFGVRVAWRPVPGNPKYKAAWEDICGARPIDGLASAVKLKDAGVPLSVIDECLVPIDTASLLERGKPSSKFDFWVLKDRDQYLGPGSLRLVEGG